MSIKLFSESELNQLSKNPYVKNITKKGITYTDEFKRIFIRENESGKLPREIFEECGFDIDIIGMKRVCSSGKRWRAGYRNDGIRALSDSRKTNSGRPRTKDLTIEEKYKRVMAQNQLLKEENELLKKIEVLERKVMRKK